MHDLRPTRTPEQTAFRERYHALMAAKREQCYGPALPTISDMLRAAQGWGVDLSGIKYQELALRCPYRSGRNYATLCWHPLYAGKVQVVIEGCDGETLLAVHEAIALIKLHQQRCIWQSCVNLQIHRAREWRERQATAPQAIDLRSEGRRKPGSPHPAVWDVTAFPEVQHVA